MKNSRLRTSVCSCALKSILSLALTSLCLLASLPVSANILGQHSLSWFDTAGGVVITQQGAPAPGPNAIHLLDLTEWHLDQAQTTAFYNGNSPIPGVNPFGVFGGLTPGSVIAPVAGAEAFIYQITHINYGSGNDAFSFTDPVPGGTAVNGLSGINISDNHSALNISNPTAGSQFMFDNSTAILDLTNGSVGAASDWYFNAFSRPENFEWSITPAAASPGITLGSSGIFGFAMPGNWHDALNDGWVHSWGLNGPAQVNIANVTAGFSGPKVVPVLLMSGSSAPAFSV